MLSRLALVAVVACAAAGALVREMGAAYVCPDGLLCLASPIGADDPRLFAALGHRLLGLVAIVSVVAAALRHGSARPLAAAVALVAVVAQPLVGVGGERMLLEPTWVMAHLGLSLLCVGALSALSWPRAASGPSLELLGGSVLALAVVAVGAAGASGAQELCTGWPLCRPSEGSAWLVDGARSLMLLALGLLAAIAVRRGRSSRAQVVLRLCGLLIGADLALFATGASPEFAVAQTMLLHVAVAGAWWLLPASGWLVADRPATSPLPTSAPPSGAPTT